MNRFAWFFGELEKEGERERERKEDKSCRKKWKISRSLDDLARAIASAIMAESFFWQMKAGSKEKKKKKKRKVEAWAARKAATRVSSAERGPNVAAISVCS